MPYHVLFIFLAWACLALTELKVLVRKYRLTLPWKVTCDLLLHATGSQCFIAYASAVRDMQASLTELTCMYTDMLVAFGHHVIFQVYSDALAFLAVGSQD